VKVKDFGDPNPGNNTYNERVQGMVQAAPIPPPGPGFTQTVTGPKVDLLPEKITPGKYGTFNVTIRNNGSDMYHGRVQLVMSIVRTDKATGKQQSETRTELRNWLVHANSTFGPVDTGVYHYLSTYNYDFTVTIKVLDAIDTNTANNTGQAKFP
jgi:hypothetical protein